MPFDRIVERVYSQTDDGEHFYDCIKNVLAANEEVTDQIELTKQQLRELMQTKKQNLPKGHAPTRSAPAPTHSYSECVQISFQPGN